MKITTIEPVKPKRSLVVEPTVPSNPFGSDDDDDVEETESIHPPESTNPFGSGKLKILTY